MNIKEKAIEPLIGLVKDSDYLQDCITLSYDIFCDKKDTIVSQTVPTKVEQFVCSYISFPDNTGIQEKTIESLINTFPEHDSVESVLMKVVLINNFYSAGLNDSVSSETISVYEMSKCICDLSNSENIDKLIKNGDKRAVHLIAQNSGFNAAYSFASKYCNWHNTECFPITDRFVRGVIYYFNKSNDEYTQQDNLLKYDCFYEKIQTFRDRYCADVSLKKLDVFLWLYGKTHNLYV